MCDHCGCRSFGPIAELTAEHEEILRLAWDLAEAHRNRVPGGEGLAAELLARLDVHNVSEEGGLYRLLLEVSDFS
ncbi:MAG TPA: hypothetical protein VHN98_04560, partial [Acidimicrobiales bacterium]|nr:hypothetical protein [Acidimicrobiales bacterium]